MAKLMLEAPDVQLVTMIGYDDVLCSILPKDQPITANNLLKAPPFNIKYNQYHVVTSVSR